MNRAQKIIRMLEELITLPKYDEINHVHNDLKHESGQIYDKLDDGNHAHHVKGYNVDSTFANDSLREDRVKGRTTTHIDYLSELTKHPTEHSFHAYRGSTDIDHSDLKKDDIIHDKGFTSTSLNPFVANKFAHEKDDGEVEHAHLFRIHVKPGTKGHYVSTHDNKLDLENKGEHEFLLHKGTKFRVGEHHEINIHGTHHKITDLHIHSQED